MIKTTTRTMYFTAYIPTKGKKKDESAPCYAAVDVKHGNMRLSKKTLIDLGMEGKFVKLFSDPDRDAIGWQIRSDAPVDELKIKLWRLVKSNSSGQATISISGILKQFRNLEEKTYKKLEIKKYVPQNQVLDAGESYFYIKVKDNDIEEE